VTDRKTGESQMHLLRVGWRNFFLVVLLCQCFVLAGNRFWFYILLMYLEYHTVVFCVSFFGCGGKYFFVFRTHLVYKTVFWQKVNFVWIFLLNPNFLLVHRSFSKMRSKFSTSVYFFLALYGSTTIDSWLFLKNIKNFVWFPKQYLLGFSLF
jgi:hypothetical protein